MGLINDPRCADALELLERTELPGGGWAALGRFYKVSQSMDVGTRFGSISQVDWGGSGNRRVNEWVTADALYVLRAAGSDLEKGKSLNLGTRSPSARRRKPGD